jgi:hypothetical protein
MAKNGKSFSLLVETSGILISLKSGKSFPLFGKETFLGTETGPGIL